FIPVSDMVALSLVGFKYNLNHQPLEKGSTLTLSNEVKEKIAQIEVHDGQVLQIRSRDAN
ncbi:thiamine diphosphokinase, partial [Staphylococcus caprae]